MGICIHMLYTGLHHINLITAAFYLLYNRSHTEENNRNRGYYRINRSILEWLKKIKKYFL